MSYSMNKTKFLSSQEYERLATTLDKFELKDFRNVALIYAMMHTGARPSELLAVTTGDLNEEGKSVFIRGLKGSRDREIPLPPKVFARLIQVAAQNYVLNGCKDERVFPIALRTLQGIWHQYRPSKKGIKSLRHTFAIRLYQKTKDVRLVQMALGHKSMSNTQVYVEYLYSLEEMKRIL